MLAKSIAEIVDLDATGALPVAANPSFTPHS